MNNETLNKFRKLKSMNTDERKSYIESKECEDWIKSLVFEYIDTPEYKIIEQKAIMFDTLKLTAQEGVNNNDKLSIAVLSLINMIELKAEVN